MSTILSLAFLNISLSIDELPSEHTVLNKSIDNTPCAISIDDEIFKSDDIISTCSKSICTSKVDFEEPVELSDTLDKFKIVVTSSEREAELT